MPPRLTPPTPARHSAATVATAAPPSPPARSAALSPQNITLFAVFLVLEALLIVALLRRVEGPPVAASSADFSRQEYIDLESTSVPVHSSKSGLDVHITIRVEASILVTGDGGERAKARDAVRANAPKIADEIARTVGAQSAEQAVDPGNRERLKDRLRAALNQSVFREEIAKEVVFRYYGP
ncbi:MAG: hypothetical protein FD180_2597 [Planctomycetota bacterium]|nr:MAG: hypothetical protein FD180_2597 [Planctomycetota bacterium]